MRNPKQKQQWGVIQEIRDWLELPYDEMDNILHRIGVIDILENAQKVCTTWRQICKDPAMWKVIYMKGFPSLFAQPSLQLMCKLAVDRSQGQLVDITIVNFANDELIQYVADRSSQLRCLEIVSAYPAVLESLKDALEKFPLLEELNLYKITNLQEAIETVGRCCPFLRTLKVNQQAFSFFPWDTRESISTLNKTALDIGLNLPKLRHLELIGNKLSYIGLIVILNRCRNLESLDLRKCIHFDLNRDFGKKCSKKIKCLKLPFDSLKGCQYYDDECFSESDDDWY